MGTPSEQGDIDKQQGAKRLVEHIPLTNALLPTLGAEGAIGEDGTNCLRSLWRIACAVGDGSRSSRFEQ